MNKNIAKISIAIIALLLTALACNLPGRQGTSDSPSVSGENPLPAVTQPLVDSQPQGVVPSGLPTVTMDGGTGYIFPNQQITSGDAVDRDVWWNAVQFVPNTVMGSLGQVDDLTTVTQIDTTPFVFGSFLPAPGEAFAIEVNRDGQITYALVRVLGVDSEARITFEVLYPFTGQVLP